jgi:hypothetical protein
MSIRDPPKRKVCHSRPWPRSASIVDRKPAAILRTCYCGVRAPLHDIDLILGRERPADPRAGRRESAKFMRDRAKSRFVALFSARMTASAINSENCRQGSSYQPIGAHSQYGFTFVLRDFGVDCFVRRSRISREVFESFRGRRRSRGKVEKETSVSQIQERLLPLSVGEAMIWVHSPTQSVAPLQASGGDGAVPWPSPLLPNSASSNPKRFDPGGHTCTENSRLSAACESKFSERTGCVFLTGDHDAGRPRLLLQQLA